VLEEAPGDRAPFSGLTGPSADSIQAKEIVEQTIGGNAVVLQDEKFKGALQSLEQIVGRMKADATEPSLKSLDVPNQSVPAEPILPRWEEILPLLQRAQGDKSCTDPRDIIADNMSQYNWPRCSCSAFRQLEFLSFHRSAACFSIIRRPLPLLAGYLYIVACTGWLPSFLP